MDKFQALFWNCKVFIDKKHQYLNNEILVQYLNLDAFDFEEIYDDLRQTVRGLLLSPDMAQWTINNYDNRVKNAQKLLTKIDNIYLALLPYCDCKNEEKDYQEQLIKCLNRHLILFDNSIRNGHFSTVDLYPDHNEYGYFDCNESSEELSWLTNFDPSAMIEFWKTDTEQIDLPEAIEVANKDIQATIAPYLRWLEDVLRVKYVYAKLLDEFYHIRHAFLNEHEIAAQFESYLETEHFSAKNYKRLGSGEPQAVSYDVFRLDNGKTVLCEAFDFHSIGAFLYIDFFRGLKNNHIPKKCQNCGKWFLLPFAKYSDYCDNPLADDPAKTCRDISARKKYEDKCKADPIWLTYNRAYKAHYARYMHKKMTEIEFEKWGMYAIELRTQALEGQLEFAEYEELIKH